jgi:hypothetical protein
MNGFCFNAVLYSAICFGGLAAAKSVVAATNFYIGSVECEAGIQTCNYHTGQVCPGDEFCRFDHPPTVVTGKTGTEVHYYCKCGT